MNSNFKITKIPYKINALSKYGIWLGFKVSTFLRPYLMEQPEKATDVGEWGGLGFGTPAFAHDDLYKLAPSLLLTESTQDVRRLAAAGQETPCTPLGQVQEAPLLSRCAKVQSWKKLRSGSEGNTITSLFKLQQNIELLS